MKTCKTCGFNEENMGKHEEGFIEIDGTFLIERPANYGPDIKERISLYACPKCGTVRVFGYFIEN